MNSCLLKEAQILYLVYREGLSSVFQSQVLTPLSLLATQGYGVQLGIFTPLGQFFRRDSRRKWQAQFATMGQSLRGRVHRIPSPPTRARWLWNDVRGLRAWISRCSEATAPFVLHCRCVEATTIAIRARAQFPLAKVIFDCRGDEPAEFGEQHRLTAEQMNTWPPELARRYRLLKQDTDTAVNQADAVVCVSHALAESLQQQRDLKEARVGVVPCCVDLKAFDFPCETRSQVRLKLGVSKNLVITYCGSLAWYQLPEHSIRVFKLLAQLTSAAHFLAVTTQPAGMRALLRKAGISETDATVLSLPPHDVPEYLTASDAGLLLRENSQVNHVAAPVKFGEYLASGTPVILTPGIGDYSEATVRFRLGEVIDLRESDTQLRERLRPWLKKIVSENGAIRERCRAFVREHLDWSRHLPTVTGLYARLLKNPPLVKDFHVETGRHT